MKTLVVLVLILLPGCLSAVHREESVAYGPTMAGATGNGRSTCAGTAQPSGTVTTPQMNATSATQPVEVPVVVRIGGMYYAAWKSGLNTYRVVGPARKTAAEAQGDYRD